MEVLKIVLFTLICLLAFNFLFQVIQSLVGLFDGFCQYLVGLMTIHIGKLSPDLDEDVKQPCGFVPPPDIIEVKDYEDNVS